MTYQTIATAPKDGTEITIRGKRFLSERGYIARAVWATRRCPATVTGWFQKEPDGRGPFEPPTHWKP